MTDKAQLKRIDRAVVHKICADQVILDLAAAVKEMIENSLDAGAKKIDIRLKDSGLQSIEIMDNGAGISPENYEGLALKHHTSKLQDFDDLQKLRTFGFRGEALSSLCAISKKVLVTTRTAKESVATKLEYDFHGKLVSKAPCAREVGTTVTLVDLFSTLPVRRKDFERNRAREFGKLLKRVQAYALIETGVRFLCSNHTKSKQIVLSSQGNGSLKAAFASTFTAKQAENLVEIELENEKVRLEGLVSSGKHGSGVNGGDRQFLYLNKRPVDIPKLTKVLNEVYRTANPHQSPMCVLNLTMDPSVYDVNVTPDKRSIFFHEEAAMIEWLKAELKTFFEPSKGMYDAKPIESFFSSSIIRGASSTSHAPEASASSLGSDDGQKSEPAAVSVAHGAAGEQRCQVLRSLDENTNPAGEAERGNNITASSASPPASQDNAVLVQPSSMPPPEFDEAAKAPLEDQDVDSQPSSKRSRVEAAGPEEESPPLSTRRRVSPRQEPAVDPRGNQSTEEPPSSRRAKRERTPIPGAPIILSQSELAQSETESEGEDVVEDRPSRRARRSMDSEADHPKQSKITEFVTSSPSPKNASQSEVAPPQSSGKGKKPAEKLAESSNKCSSGPIQPVGHGENVLASGVPSEKIGAETAQSAPGEFVLPPSITLACDWAAVANAYRQDPCAPGCDAGAAASNAAGAASTLSVERETTLQERKITKADFVEMRAIGQFNLGFIIGKLQNDLYILDQHACDEKYQFETLQETTKINTQKLISPTALELTAADEMVVLENLPVFTANGFEFEINEDAEPGSRVRLSAVPLSKQTVFGAADVHELIMHLRDSPGELVRPSRVTAMFASRACRSAIMIGDPLDKELMTRTIRRLGTMDQPWNCPHGRPTMRHLFDLRYAPPDQENSYNLKPPEV